MPDIEKDFFLARPGRHDYRASNRIPVHSRLVLLEGRWFARGQGAEFKEFLLGPVHTREAKPRTLPGKVFHAVERFVSAYRRQKAGQDTAYIVQLMARGSPRLGWTLERAIGAREARWGVDDEHLRIECFHRTLSYRVVVTAFDNARAMDRWRRAYGLLPLANQHHHKTPLPPHEQEYSWFETMAWQHLPDEFVARLTDEARAFVFPSYGAALKEALYRDRWDFYNPFLFVPEVMWHFMGAAEDRHGPANHVWTHYYGHLATEFYAGVLPQASRVAGREPRRASGG